MVLRCGIDLATRPPDPAGLAGGIGPKRIQGHGRAGHGASRGPDEYNLRIANPIYAEAASRGLGYILQSSLDVQAAWYVDGDGRLNLTKLLTAFRTFFGEHSEHWLGRFAEYPEAGPQLILQAYLHRVVNGGGRIEREYGLGRDRTDLLAPWPREAGQPSELRERFVVECKVLRDSDRKSLEWTVERGWSRPWATWRSAGRRKGIWW